MTNKTDFLENKQVDLYWRGQAFSTPVTIYFALFTVAPGDAGGGTEVTGGSYARVGVSASLANFAGTQGVGTTTASSGTSGTTSNNNAITFPTPTANWGVVTHVAVFDAASAGNMHVWAVLTIAKTINNGDAAPSFTAGAFTFQEDN